MRIIRTKNTHMVTNQTIVLKALYWNGKSMTPSEIVKDTGLRLKQVYMTLWSLKKMNYIKTKMIPLHYVNGEMVNNHTSSELANPILAERTLKKRGVL